MYSNIVWLTDNPLAFVRSRMPSRWTNICRWSVGAGRTCGIITQTTTSL